MKVVSKFARRRFTRVIITFVVMGALLVLLLAASRNQMDQPLKGYEVRLNDEHEYSVIQKRDIESWLHKNKDLSFEDKSINMLDLERMEQIVETNPWIENAEIFVDNRKTLQIDILQRSPLARVFTNSGKGFYLDSNLKEMPVSPGYYYPAPVFTNYPVDLPDSTKRRYLNEIAYIGTVIEADTFWNAQVSQISILPDRSYVLVPLLGEHKILIGDTSRLKEKLHNLLVFYRQVSNKAGWDLYTTLDARFKGQIVASPSQVPLEESEKIKREQKPADANSTVDLRERERPLEQRPPPPSRRQTVRPSKTTQNFEKTSGQQAEKSNNSKNKESDQPKYIYTGN